MRIPFLGAIASAVLVASAGAAPVTAGDRSPAAPMPELVAASPGETLSAPSALAPETAARAFLLRGVPGITAPLGVNLALVAATPLVGGGTLVRLQQRVGGLEILGAQVTVRLRQDGAVLWAMSALVPAGVLSGEVRLSPLEAVDRAYQLYAPARAGELRDARMAQLVAVALPGGGLRRGWQVTLPSRADLLSALRCLVNAEDGSALGLENAARTAGQARVFEINPALSGDATLHDVPHVPAAAMFLDDGLVKGENCVEQHQLVARSTGTGSDQIHVCTEVQSAAVDGATGDWAYPEVLDPGTGKVGGGDGTTPFEVDDFDRFAEVSMYYQVRKAYDVFKAWSGARQLLREQPIPAIANYRGAFGPNGTPQQMLMAAQDPNGMLWPFDNAVYLPKGPIIPGVPRNYDSMMFGQGTYVDFAYDGITVYHELTHAVIDSSTGLRTNRLDRWGLDNAPSALNEGYADFFAGVISGHADLDAYTGIAYDQLGVERRALDNPAICPNNLQGEPHHDSLPWSAALWAARVALGTTPARQQAFDLDAFHALFGLTQTPSFAAAAMATLTELGSDATFTTSDVNLARTKMSDRGQLACERVLRYAMPITTLWLEGTSKADVVSRPYMPGYAQIRIDLSATSPGLDVIVESSQPEVGASAVQPRVIVRRGADPIQFTYAGGTTTGNDDPALATPMTVQGQGYVAHVPGNFGPGPVHVMIVNTGSGGAQLTNVAVEPLPTVEPNDDAALAADGGAGDGAVKPPGGGGSCGCRTGGARTSGGLALLSALGLAALLARRSRRG